MADASLPDGTPVATTVQMARGRSDLRVRLASAAVMLAVAGAAFWLGGMVLDAFIIAVAIATLVEFTLLVTKAPLDRARQTAALLAGVAYIGYAGLVLISLPALYVLILLGTVIFTDTGAYFVGRAIGGPKLAPRISPAKTWAGFFGGMAAAAAWVVVAITAVRSAFAEQAGVSDLPLDALGTAALVGAALAMAAQAGDLFESWLKRKAGVKDSSTLIPGHGGVFDRVDGILPVAVLAGLVSAWPS